MKRIQKYIALSIIALFLVMVSGCSTYVVISLLQMALVMKTLSAWDIVMDVVILINTAISWYCGVRLIKSIKKKVTL